MSGSTHRQRKAKRLKVKKSGFIRAGGGYISLRGARVALE